MQAVILAGGKGTRLGGLTKTTPKPMLAVNKKPFLEHLLINLKSNGIKDIVVCAGYLAHKIKAYFRDGSRIGVRIRYSVEDKLLGTGGALRKAETFLNQNFILLNGDTYIPIDYKSLWKHFKQLDKIGLVAVRKQSGNISVKGILITRYDKSGKSENLEFTDAGVQVFKKKILEFIMPNQVVSLEEEIFPKLIKEKQLAAYITKEIFYDIGTHDRLKTAEGILK